MRIKILNMNACYGFNAYYPKSQEFVFEPERLEAARQIVKEANPNILLVTEACFHIYHPGTKVYYQEAFEMPYHFHGSATGSRYGNSILSKYPFLKTENFSMQNRTFTRTSIDIGSKILNFDSAHPHPSLLEEERAMFFRNVLRDRSQERYIIAGDFNSWPDDVPNRDRDKYLSKFKQFYNAVEAERVVDDLMQCLVIPEVRAHGLIDTYRKIHPSGKAFTIPTDLENKDKSTAERLDYIFCSSDVKILDAGIIKGPEAERVSDHHPIYATLDV